MSIQRKNREIILQLLFAFDFGGEPGEELVCCLMQVLSMTRQAVKAASEKAVEIWAERELLDNEISSRSEAFDFERIGRVERSILRLGLFELHAEELPSPVVIAEAVRLAKKFASPEAAGYVNALLDHHHVALSS